MAIATCGNCQFTDLDVSPGTCHRAGHVAVFMSLIELVIRSQCFITEACKRVSDSYPPEVDYTTFDYIVIGAGPAGAVIASRLSEEDNNVLLLEAGPEEPVFSSILPFTKWAIGSHIDWKYETVPQKNACLHTGGVCNLPRGKTMGGSSVLSGMMYTRGSAAIYNQWEAAGNAGWSYEDVLEYFRKSEDNRESKNEIDDQYHGFGGVLPVQRYPHKPPIVDDMIQAAIERGYRVGDLNGATNTGFNIAPMMQKDGIRATTSRSFIRNRELRGNLTVLINSFVTKININRRTKFAKSVNFVNDGKNRRAMVSKEVIVCAGVVGSPQILLLSGVGPAKDLKKLRIPVVQDLPVGQNLHHHVSVDVNFKTRPTSEKVLSVESLEELLKSKTGPLTSTGLTQVTGFLETNYTEKGLPDIQFFMDSSSPECSEYGCDPVNLNEKVDLIIRPSFMLSKNRGYIKLTSRNPFAYPEINPNYLKNGHDIEALLFGINAAIRLAESESLSKWNITLNPEPKEMCKDAGKYPSTEYWKCVIRTYTLPENHHAGTCKMGPSPKDSVVDSQLRVHGINNLRVADASIFPSQLNCNTIAPVIMIGETAADMIKNADLMRFVSQQRNS